MLFDLRELEDTAPLQSDVCIVGAGAAGMTLARALLARGHTVCVLESGGFDFEAQTQAFYEGDNLGFEYYGLVDSRLRFLGGTTNIWGGRCALLDPIDFKRRDWVPHSGWPLESAQLEPWYRIAHAELELGDFDYGPAPWRRLVAGAPDFDPRRIDVKLWRFDELSERFAAARSRDMLAAPGIRVCLHANVVRVCATVNGAGIEQLCVRALGGPERAVRARHYVLACGGIENARILLASRDVEPQGIGNAHDQVGRYFMEHPHGRLGRVDGPHAHFLWSMFQKRLVRGDVPIAPVVRLAEAEQREQGALNGAVTFKLQRDPKRGLPLGKAVYQHLKHVLAPDRKGRMAYRAMRVLRAWNRQYVRVHLERLRARLGVTGLHVIVRAEQAPNPDSRVCLSQRRDPFGNPLADLDWRMGVLDKHSVGAIARTLDAEFRRLGLGTLEAADWTRDPDPRWPVDATVGNHPIGGYHHMGATRMSLSPHNGVVDADCRVHGHHNLYIAGSSVFSTGGWANPTLTILALAHRLADHLDGQLRN